MSLKDKASKIDFGALPGMSAPAGGTRPKTAPGAMMAHAGDQRSELLQENDALRTQVESLAGSAARVIELQDELRGWDGAKATRLIDPGLIARSRWANRDERNYESVEFRDLKAEIGNAGGNVQPIKVRPLLPAKGGDGQQRYEVVYGHRRLEACRQLGLPVLALVDNLDDRSLFVEMDRENRSRKDLSAWEQGAMYRRALDEGLYPSNRKLAEAVGADLSNVGKALSLADLPVEIVQAFATPMDLQYRWAKPLKDAMDKDPGGVRKRALALIQTNPRPSAKVVFDQLIGAAGQGGSTVLPPKTIEIVARGKRASVSMDSKGRAAISIEAGLVRPDQMRGLAELIESFLNGTKKK